MWMLITPLLVQAQLGCTKQEICNYEHLFKSLEENQEGINGYGFDSTLFFFNFRDNICTDVVIFTHSDRFLLETIFKIDTNYSFTNISVNKTSEFDIYRLTSNNLLK